MDRNFVLYTIVVCCVLLMVGVLPSVADECSGHSCRNVISMPLMDDMKATLKADLDVTNMNNHLKAYIEQEIRKGVETAMKDVMRQLIDNKLQEANTTIEATILEELKRIGVTYVRWGRKGCPDGAELHGICFSTPKTETAKINYSVNSRSVLEEKNIEKVGLWKDAADLKTKQNETVSQFISRIERLCFLSGQTVMMEQFILRGLRPEFVVPFVTATGLKQNFSVSEAIDAALLADITMQIVSKPEPVEITSAIKDNPTPQNQPRSDGRDFMHDQKAEISFPKQVLSLQNGMTEVSLSQGQDRDRTHNFVRVLSDVTFQPRQRVIFPVKIDNFSENTSGVIEPNFSLAGKHNIMGARCLIQTHNNNSVFEILNPTNSVITLKQNTIVGNFIKIQDDKIFGELKKNILSL
ncbi:unnamed protein product [Mytilus coruscus]|uniref:Uncharacterized protein n=1 Tax=Mytilus coruscus TaxID=42192 RepID=A0A6J8B1F5_MYTCO|nr:unnamed protein product [Mytilus coruscus]